MSRAGSAAAGASAMSVVSVNVSAAKGMRKSPVAQARLVAGHGLTGDAHAGPGDRQVSLLGLASIESMRGRGTELDPGDFAENLTTAGIDLPKLPVGSLLAVGDTAVLRITRIGKTCHAGCAIRREIGDCVMPREGVFAEVVEPGVVRPGDRVEVLTSEDRPTELAVPAAAPAESRS